MGAHLPHLLGKLPHRLEQATIFKVAEDLVPVLQSAEIVDLLVEQPGYQFALFPTAGNRLNDLIEVEVGDEGTVCRVLDAGSTVVQLPDWPAWGAAPSATLAVSASARIWAGEGVCSGCSRIGSVMSAVLWPH
jgi:hypothetical protein